MAKARDKKGEFTSLVDFCNKVDSGSINKRMVESLVKAGAFDCFGVYRSQLLAVYEKVIDSASNERKKNIDGQVSLFATLTKEFKEIEIKYPDIKEFDKKYKLAMEKEMTGLYLTGHPLEDYEEALKNKTSAKTIDIMDDTSIDEDLIDEAAKLVEEENAKVKDGDRVILGGLITEVTRKITKTNNMMAFLKLEDLYSTIEIVVFPKVLETFRDSINEDEIVLIKGRVSKREDEQPKVLCDAVEKLTKFTSKKLYIQVENNEEVKIAKNELRTVCARNSGNIPIYLCTKEERKKYLLSREYWISEESNMLNFLKEKYGNENIKLL
jgi:DNA polymerase-3 subunit alpha